MNTKTLTNLNLYYQNTRGLNTKTNELYVNTCDCSFNIIILSETWLTDAVNSTELFPNVYNVVRADRNFKKVNRSKGGGVLIAISNEIIYSPVDCSSINDAVPLIDLLVVNCCIGNFHFYICTVYIPPDVPFDQFETFLLHLELILHNKLVLLIGDFNLPNFYNSDINCAKSTSLRIFCSSLELHQYNFIYNTNNRLLDLAFSNINDDTIVLSADSHLVSLDSHHPALDISVKLNKTSPTNFPSFNDARYNFRKGDYVSLYNELFTTDWSFLENHLDVNVAVQSFYETLYNILDKHVPKYRFKSSRTFPFWFTANIKLSLKRKNRVRLKWLKTRNSMDLKQYKQIRATTKTLIREAYNKYLNDIQTKLKSQPADLWNFANSKRGVSRIPGKLNDNNCVYTTPKEIVDAFAQSFSRFFSEPSSLVAKDLPTQFSNFCISRVSEKKTARYFVWSFKQINVWRGSNT